MKFIYVQPVVLNCQREKAGNNGRLINPHWPTTQVSKVYVCRNCILGVKPELLNTDHLCDCQPLGSAADNMPVNRHWPKVLVAK